MRPADIPIAERASMNYWRTQKCISKPPEFPIKSPAFTGLHERAPLGLMDTPLLDTEEEVHYCFLPLDLVGKYPTLVNDDNLLWLLANAALIECECSEFRFIVNFLRSEKILLPDNFSSIEVLEAEVVTLGIPKLIDAVKIYKGNCSVLTSNPEGSKKGLVDQMLEVQEPVRPSLYVMALGILVKYPDSALGQLHIESTLDGNQLYISGNGVLFQHVKNWLGTCRLPLTENMSEIHELCAYLDERDVTYEPMKDALKSYLKQKMPAEVRGHSAAWTAEIRVYSLHQIVKIYVGSHWYETYLQTLLKCPELLSNFKKVYWITYGQTLLVHGDGQIFRHVLNFLRLGKLFLPSEFKEWSLFCQEAEEYRIPSLFEALQQCDGYRLWVKKHEAACPFQKLNIVTSNKEQEFSRASKEEHSSAAVDFSSGGISPWSRIKAVPASQGEHGAYTRGSCQPRGRKRRTEPGADEQPAALGVHASCCSPSSESPPRKKAGRGDLTKKSENRSAATPIQKLISLVKEWDMVSAKGCEVQQVMLSNSRSVDKVPCHTALHNGGNSRAPAASFPGKISHAMKEPAPALQAAAGATGNHPEKCMFKESLPVPLPAQRDRFSTTKESYPMEKSAAAQVWWGQEQTGKEAAVPDCPNVVPQELSSGGGFILKAEHPPVVGSDGSCTWHEESVVYCTGLSLARAKPPPVAKDIVFLSFALAREEIFYARKCHCFLTDIILRSIRQQDAGEITAKLVRLVHRLWTQQMTPKEFVADILNTKPFNADWHVHEKLLRWLEFTLPFAWKYSHCIDLLIQKGYAKAVAYFGLGK
ncbi:BTB/POZ domain-containing protein KCTD19 isoform X2 [Carettochelys insculpta]